MRVVLQRVKFAEITANPDYYSRIEQGLLIFLGIENTDLKEDIEWLTDKICKLRIFSDANNKMNLSLLDTRYEAMVISQFTIHASTKKGNRPSFTKAAKPSVAKIHYEDFILKLSQILKQDIKTGVFGANMQINLQNDGPVTIIIDSKNKL